MRKKLVLLAISIAGLSGLVMAADEYPCTVMDQADGTLTYVPSADTSLFVSDCGELTITTSGGIVAHFNSSLNNNFTRDTDRIDSEMKSSPKGIRADG